MVGRAQDTSLCAVSNQGAAGEADDIRFLVIGFGLPGTQELVLASSRHSLGRIAS
jgi:hypothetical protein